MELALKQIVTRQNIDVFSKIKLHAHRPEQGSKDREVARNFITQTERDMINKKMKFRYMNDMADRDPDCKYHHFL